MFGRDSLVTALQTAWFPEVTVNVLRLLARYQGATVDDWKDEQPGKILHELRRGELAQAKAIRFNPYYGTVDATMLFVILLHRYYEVTGDLTLLRDLADPLERALEWMEKYGDLDGDGFVEYERRSPGGLENQGWKDSWDAIMHADGSLVEPPVAVVEPRGTLTPRARRLQRSFSRSVIRSRRRSTRTRRTGSATTSTRPFGWRINRATAWHLTNTSVQPASSVRTRGKSSGPTSRLPDHARKVAQRLMRPDMFSGWGIRTLSADEIRYNPMGYHTGGVWPHDNSLIALGFKRYGLEDKMLAVLSGLYDVAQRMPDGQLPELTALGRAALRPAS